MIDREFLRILACPETKQPLQQADLETVSRLNQAIQAGKLVNRSGHKIEEKIDAGLVREDGKVLYIIRDDIPVMLVEESVSLESPKASAAG